MAICGGILATVNRIHPADRLHGRNLPEKADKRIEQPIETQGALATYTDVTIVAVDCGQMNL